MINSRVAWAEKREHIGRLAVFDAKIIADGADQPEGIDGAGELRRIPVLYPGEQQLPSGEGEPPPAEPALPGLEADLPGSQPPEE